MRAIVALVLFVCTGGVASAARPISSAQRKALAYPSAAVIAQVDQLLPGVVALIQSTEANALAHGRPLSTDEIAIARKVGITAPDRVRVIEEDASNASPTAAHEPTLAALIRRLGAGNPRRWGLTARYGIVFKTVPTKFLLAHELHHVAQYERLGLAGFARRYITELLAVGYALAPLEAEANAAAAPYKGMP